MTGREGHREPGHLFLVGCPRSGTSVCAAFLEELGLPTVEDTRKSEEYPAGYREPLPLLMFHKAMERYPRAERNYRAESAIAREPFLRTAYLDDEYVRSGFSCGFGHVTREGVSFTKFPQLALSIPFLLETFEDCRIVALWRNPVNTFRSLVTKEFPLDRLPGSLARAFLMWRMYADHILRAVRRAPDRVAVVNIDDVIGGGGQLLRRLLDDFGFEVEATAHVTDVLERDQWTAAPSLRWRLLLRSVQGAVRASLSGFPGDSDYVKELGFSDDWKIRLRNVTVQRRGS